MSNMHGWQWTIIAILPLLVSCDDNNSKLQKALERERAAQHELDESLRSLENYEFNVFVKSWRCYNENDYMHIVGEVQNLTDKPLDAVEVVGTFRNENDEVVKTAHALVDYQPLMPGQTSPFMALTTHNPEISSCTISFSILGGGEISSITRQQMVDRMQRDLTALGYFKGKEDGKESREFRGAIVAFAKAHGIKAPTRANIDLARSIASEKRKTETKKPNTSTSR